MTKVTKALGKALNGFKSIAIIQILMCLGFFINPGTEIHGNIFGICNSVGAGILFCGSLLAYLEPKRWLLGVMTTTMAVLVVFNTIMFLTKGGLFPAGFHLLAYDCLFIVACCHFLGRGLPAIEHARKP